MKRSIVLSIVVAVLMIFMGLQTSVFAYPSTGDDIKFTQVDGGDGGRFVATFGDMNNSNTWNTFETFCLETNEYISTGSWYYIYKISDSAEEGGSGGPSPDPISYGTAYLYTQFVNGAYSNMSDWQYRNLQKAIWTLEEEGTFTGEGDSGDVGTINWFLTQAANSGWQDIGNVRVLNIQWSADDTRVRQDMLTIVPEPTTILLSGLGLLGMGAFLRRKKSRKA